MTPNELAAELSISAKTLRAWLRDRWPRVQPHAPWELSEVQINEARARWGDGAAPKPGVQPTARPSPAGSRADSDEAYVIDLLDEILGSKGTRQHRFPWLLGDPNSRGHAVQLPVDAYWPKRALVVEYRERQHDEAVSFFDKPDRLTISGVHRGEQRRIYDERREAEVPAHGLQLLIIRPAQLDADDRGRLRRNRASDVAMLRLLVVGT